VSAIVSANGLYGDRAYALQVRPVYEDGSAGGWGPTFAIIKRTLDATVLMYDLINSSTGIRVSWEGSLNRTADYDEQWVVKKLDRIYSDQDTLENDFDSSGITVYRGSGSTTVDVDLSQEEQVTFGIVKMDRYGNRSPVVKKDKVFEAPDSPSDITLKNKSGGFNINFLKNPISLDNEDKNKYAVVKIKYGEPFQAFGVVKKVKNNGVCSLTVTGGQPSDGDKIQVNTADPDYDGIYKIAYSVSGVITYYHSIINTVAEAVPSTPGGIFGHVIPTSNSPSEQGLEILRSEIIDNEAVSVSLDYTPDLSGQKIYIAVGTEDAFKNLSSWTLLDLYGGPLTYGRNYIAEGQYLTALGESTNKIADSYWKYGYIGWNSVHNSSKELNTATTAGRVIAKRVAAVPDKIQLGVSNGSSSTLAFTDPGSATQSRIYPSLLNNQTIVNTDHLSDPMIDGTFFVPNDESTLNPLSAWPYLNDPASDGERVGMVWAECSATSVADDSVNTKFPVELDGVTNLTGSFKAKIDSWGNASIPTKARLKMYAVAGDWTVARPQTVYDPHFNPLYEYSEYDRVTSGSFLVTNRVKVSNTCTLTLESGRSSYPSPGQLISVSIGDSNFDGNWIVQSMTGQTLVYEHSSSGSVSSSPGSHGSLSILSYDYRYGVTNKQKSGGTATITVNSEELPEPGELIDVRIADPTFDGENVVVTASAVTGSNVGTISYASSGTVSSTAVVTPYASVVKRAPAASAPSVSLIKEWSISTENESDFYVDGTFQERTLYWNWNTTSSESINTLRLVWVLEFRLSDFLTGDDGDVNNWVANRNYLISISEFDAWPGVNTYAEIGSENQFTDEQEFLAGASITGNLNVDGNVSVAGDLDVSGTGYIENLTVENFSVNGPFELTSSDSSINGAPIQTTSTHYLYTKDYPNRNATVTATGNEETINSMRILNKPDVSVDNYLALVSWTGRFKNGSAAATYIFRLYKLQNDGVTNQWQQVKSFAARGDSPGGTLFHMHRNAWEFSGDKPAYRVTVQASTTGAGLSAITTSDNQVANDISILLIPSTRSAGLTQKAPQFDLDEYTNVRADDVGSAFDDANTETIRISSGWKNTYDGSGSSTSTGGDLVHGYKSSNRGNQKSAWGLAANDWVSDGGKYPSTNTNIIDDGVNILSCQLIIRPNNEDTGGKVTVVGTHNDDKTSSVSNWSNLTGKNSDRVRSSQSGNKQQTIDLGVEIGKELWNGHARYYWHPGGTIPVFFQGVGNAKGIILGPGPSTADKFYSTFDRSSVELVMKVQWVETSTDTG
jgi:hypothetical protein